MHLSHKSRTVKADCPAGQQFYVCQANNFRGCCSVDACDHPTCPDIAFSSSSLISVSPPTTTVTATVGTQLSTSSTISSASTTTTTQSMMNAGVVGYTTSVTLSTTALATSDPSLTQAATSSASSGPSKSNITLIVVGVVVGSIAVSIMSVLVWFCLRRRKDKRKKAQQSINQYGGKQNEFVLDLPSMRGSFHGSEVFAPFGGQYRSQQSSRTESRTAQTGLPSTRSTTPHVGHLIQSQTQVQNQNQNQTQTHGRGQAQKQPSSQPRAPPTPPQTSTPSHQAQAAAISAAASPDLNINSDSTASLPLLPSDPEKAALSPPPQHLHPIYSLTPTIRPRRQTQPSLSTTPNPHPGTPLTPSLEPIPSQLSSSLNNLPSFMHNPTFAYEREQRFKGIPRRTSEVRRSTTTSRRHRLWRNSEYDSRSLSQGSNTPDPSSVAELEGSPPILNSPIPGRSELEGDMSFLSLIQTPPIIPSRSIRRQSRYPNQTANIGYESPIIGVGLGVDPGTETPTSLYSQDSFALPPRQFHPPQPRSPLTASRSMDFLRTDGFEREREAMIVSPMSPDEQGAGGRWRDGNEDVMGMGGPSAFAARRRREELTPLSGVSVDVEREWGSWALR